jgi:hypothetical protein
MSKTPFVLRAIRPPRSMWDLSHGDAPSVEDPLPAPVDIDAIGYARSRRTLVTDVKRETTDDN